MCRKLKESASLRVMMPVLVIVVACCGVMTVAVMLAETSPVQMTAVLPWWVLLWRVVLSYSARVCYDQMMVPKLSSSIYVQRGLVWEMLPVPVYSSSLVYWCGTMHIRQIVGCLGICYVRGCDLRRLWTFWCPVPVRRPLGCPGSTPLLSPTASNSSRIQSCGPP